MDQCDQTIKIVKSREDSFERLTEEVFKEFPDRYSLEDECERHILLSHAISCLNSKEQELIYSLYFSGLSERTYSKMSGIPQKTVNNRKKAVLKRLRQFLKE